MAESQAGLTFEEHRDLSRELSRTQRQLDELGALAAGVYGSESRAAIALIEASEAIGRIRYELQSQASQDCPGRRADDLYR